MEYNPMSEEKTGGRAISTEGGAYIEGEVNVTSGGDFVGRDKIVNYHGGTDVADLAQLFEAIYHHIEARPQDPNVDKEEIASEVKKIEDEAAKGEQANPSKIERWLGNLAHMAPDIWDVTVATLSNPAAGIALVVKKIAKKAKESTQTA
jgi:hypothetical protein